MNNEEKARVIIQGASLQGIHFDGILPQLQKLGYDADAARRLMDEYSMRTDLAFRRGIAHRIVGLILIGAGAVLIIGTLIYLATVG